MQHTRQNTLTIALYFILTLLYPPCSAANADYSPFQTRDQNPFTLIQGQPLPVNAVITHKNKWLWTNTLAITNTLNRQQTTKESIWLDVESYRFNTGIEYGLGDNWAIKIDLPVTYKGAGFLDSFINNWHKFFNLPQGERPYTKNNQYRVQRTQSSQIITDLSSADIGIGDLQLSLARQVSYSRQSSLSLWGGIKFPTGSSRTLNGNAAIDLSAWLAYNRKLSAKWLLNTNAGIVLPAVIVTGNKSANNSNISTYAGFAYMMIGWQPMDSLDLKVQLEAHSSYYKNSGLRMLGSTYLVTFGSSVHINQCNSMDLAVSEDIKVDASPDVSFLLSWRYLGGC